MRPFLGFTRNTLLPINSCQKTLWHRPSSRLNLLFRWPTQWFGIGLSVLCLADLLSVDLSSDGSANHFTSICTVLTSSLYRGAFYAFPFFLALCKRLFVSRGSWSFLAHRVAEAHFKFLKNIHPWVLFQQWRPEGYLRQAPQARCGPKWTISRSEQYPEGPYMYSPWSLFNIYGRGQHLLNKWSNRDPWAAAFRSFILN